MNKCIVCGSTEFDKGVIEESTYKNLTSKSFFPWKCRAKIKASLCLKCGNICLSVIEKDLIKFR